jgi:hypothetical protein
MEGVCKYMPFDLLQSSVVAYKPAASAITHPSGPSSNPGPTAHARLYYITITVPPLPNRTRSAEHAAGKPNPRDRLAIDSDGGAAVPARPRWL